MINNAQFLGKKKYLLQRQSLKIWQKLINHISNCNKILNAQPLN